MSKLDGLSTSEPTSFGSIYGAYNAEVKNAEMEKKTARTGSVYYDVRADVSYQDEGGNERTRKIFGRLPFDWKKEDKQFGSLYQAFGTEWENLINAFEAETEGEVVVLMGAKRHWETNEVVTYTDNNGKERISYEPIEFAPAGSDLKKVWTPGHEKDEIAAREEVAGTSPVNSSGAGEGDRLATKEDLVF